MTPARPIPSATRPRLASLLPVLHNLCCNWGSDAAWFIMSNSNTPITSFVSSYADIALSDAVVDETCLDSAGLSSPTQYSQFSRL